MTDRAHIIEQLPAPFSDGRPSILSLIQAAVARRALDEDGVIELPDPEAEEGVERVRFVAGALDALIGGGSEAASAGKIEQALRRAVRQPSFMALQHLYSLLKQGGVSGVVDDCLALFAGEVDAHREAVAALARRLVREAPDVEPVKMGVALLGVSGAPDDEALICEIGLSDEFTLYSVVALSNLMDDPAQSIWRLAQRVHGWGRIAAVERLEGVRDPAIQQWLLRGGFRNAIMNEYLAHIAATTGGLAPALDAGAIDDELMEAAADLLVALIPGGPGPDIDAYAEAAQVCLAFLRHAQQRSAPTLGVVAAVQMIQRLAGEDGRKSKPGWSAQLVLDLRTQSAEFLRRPAVREAIEQGLNDEDRVAFWRAAELAPLVGLDAWPFCLARQRRRKDEHWWRLMQTDDPARVEAVLALAREQLNLELVGSGPSAALGLGPGFADDTALDFIVQELRRFPGAGWDLVAVGLRGRSTRLRNMAINALRGWGRAHWPAEAEAAVQAALAREVDDRVRERFAKLLSGEAQDA